MNLNPTDRRLESKKLRIFKNNKEKGDKNGKKNLVSYFNFCVAF